MEGGNGAIVSERNYAFAVRRTIVKTHAKFAKFAKF